MESLSSKSNVLCFDKAFPGSAGVSSFRKRLRLFYRFEGEQVYEFPCIFVNDKQMNIQNIKPNQYETTPFNTCHHPISMLDWLVGKGQTNHHYQWIDHWKKCKENHVFWRKAALRKLKLLTKSW